jgi:hypothetical protein
MNKTSGNSAFWRLALVTAFSLSAFLARPNTALATTDKPLHLNIGAIEIIEIRSNADMAAYRALIDGQVREERTISVKGARKLLMSVDAYNRYAVNLNFADHLHAMLLPDFAGIENQCSRSMLAIPPAQQVDLAGWTSIYRLTISDPCQHQEHELDIQIKGSAPP